jgi:hypothetical protein
MRDREFELAEIARRRKIREYQKRIRQEQHNFRIYRTMKTILIGFFLLSMLLWLGALILLIVSSVQHWDAGSLCVDLGLPSGILAFGTGYGAAVFFQGRENPRENLLSAQDDYADFLTTTDLGEEN